MHERVVRVVYKDYNSSFDELLEKNNSLRIHDRNLQKLVTESAVAVVIRRKHGRENFHIRSKCKKRVTSQRIYSFANKGALFL